MASYSANEEMTGLSSRSVSNLTDATFEIIAERLCVSPGCGFRCPLASKIFHFLNFHFPPSSVNSAVQDPFLTCLTQEVP